MRRGSPTAASSPCRISAPATSSRSRLPGRARRSTSRSPGPSSQASDIAAGGRDHRPAGGFPRAAEARTGTDPARRRIRGRRVRRGGTLPRERAHAPSQTCSPRPLGLSLSGDALARGVWSLEARDNPRLRPRPPPGGWDDTPAGGGPGMVIRADVLAQAIDDASPRRPTRAPRLLMSPRGRPAHAGLRTRPRRRARRDESVCGRFRGRRRAGDRGPRAGRGLDRRLRALRRAEIAANGAARRRGGASLPGVMGAHASGEEEKLRGRAARIPPTTPGPGSGRGPRDPRRASLRQPRGDRPLAARAGAGPHQGGAGRTCSRDGGAQVDLYAVSVIIKLSVLNF